MKELFIYSFFKTKQKYALFAMFASGCRWKFIHTITIHHGRGYLKSYATPTVPLPQKNYFAFVNLCHRCPHQKIIISSLKYPPAISILCNLYQIHQTVSRIFCTYEFTKLSRYWVCLLILMYCFIHFRWKIRSYRIRETIWWMLLTCLTWKLNSVTLGILSVV